MLCAAADRGSPISIEAVPCARARAKATRVHLPPEVELDGCRRIAQAERAHQVRFHADDLSTPFPPLGWTAGSTLWSLSPAAGSQVSDVEAASVTSDR
jgi:hypothetical protein